MRGATVAGALALGTGAWALECVAFYVVLTANRPPFDNPLARRAVAMALGTRRHELARLTGMGPEACRIVPPNYPGYTAGCPSFERVDGLDAAKRLANSIRRSIAGIFSVSEAWYCFVQRPILRAK